MEYLIAVAECGTISLAAERASVSAPSVSTGIGLREAAFGLQLVVRRHAQGVSVTVAGHQVTEAARAVLASTGALSDLAAEITGADHRTDQRARVRGVPSGHCTGGAAAHPAQL